MTGRGVRSSTRAGPSDVLAVLLTGPPAAGKTTVGRELARRLGAALLDLDTATAPLVAVVADLVGVEDLDDSRLADATRSARYETLLALAEDNLHAGTAVVLVAPFTAERSDQRAWPPVEHRLQAAGGRPALLCLRLEPEVLLQRMRARGAARHRATLDDLAGYSARLHVTEPHVTHIAVEAGGPVQDVVHEAVAALGKES